MSNYKIQTLDVSGGRTAWAIFFPMQPEKEELNDKEFMSIYKKFKFPDHRYIFHSAHWSKARSKQMVSNTGWLKVKIVKIKFTIVN
jgi:hypothetical protein